MTDLQIRIAIAEKCGKTWFWDGRDLWIATDDLPASARAVKCPDYPNDLNAAHEVEKSLIPKEQHEYYENFLREVTGYGCMSISHQNTRKIVSATARQRCEALLRTWGLWKD